LWNHFAGVLTILIVQRLIGERKWSGRLQEVWKVRRGPKGVPSTLPKRFTVIGSQETAFVSFYRKFAGVLQDVLWLLQDVSTGCSERGFWRVDGGRQVKK